MVKQLQPDVCPGQGRTVTHHTTVGVMASTVSRVAYCQDRRRYQTWNQYLS